MEWPDYVILAILTLSILVGLFRGFLSEAMGLAIWAAAFWLAFTFVDEFSPLLVNGIELPSARTAIAFAILFFAALVVGGLLSWVIGQMVEKTGLSGTDRLLGSVFGLVRGLAIVVLLLLFAGFTPLPKDPWWQNSQLIPRILPLAEWSAGFIPESLSQYLDLSQSATVLDENQSNNELVDDAQPEVSEGSEGDSL